VENREKGIRVRFFKSKEESKMRTPNEINVYYGLLNDEYNESKDFRTLIKIRELAQFMQLKGEKITKAEARLDTLKKLYKVDRDFRTRIKIQVWEYVLGLNQ